MNVQVFAKKLILKLKNHHMLDWMSDAAYLRLMYWTRLHGKLDFKNPQSFNEKLQWLKLHDHNPQYTNMVDKYEVKKYVAERIGEQYVIPTLGVWNTFDEIDFNTLPDRFVLKCTHDSGGLVICKKKSQLNIAEARKKIEKSLKTNYYLSGREWPYKNIKPRIIAEQYMEDKKQDNAECLDTGLTDFKFYCFNGKVKAVMIATNRFSDLPTYFDYFDREYNHISVVWGNPNSPIPPKKPESYDEMVKIADKLSEGIPHVRVDLYQSDNKVYFGELTFYDGSGFDAIEPHEWALKFGSWIDLNTVKI